MSTIHQEIEQRPQEAPPAGESKRNLDMVYAASGGELFEIPLDVARQYAVGEDRAKELGNMAALGDEAQQGDTESEVGGRHRIGGRFHGYWAIGVYQWHVDGRWYRGPHWHPRAWSQLACDIDCS